MTGLLFACLLATAVDGDTLRCRDLASEGPQGEVAELRADLDSVNGRVRLARIDAPERGEPGFDEAKVALEQLINGQEVNCTLVDADPRVAGFQSRDRYGRPVARCSAGGRDLGNEMLSRALAERWP
ncbi:thermonuclease family protein [Citromicrobium bathyomarinum]|uniref:thermonuclease family protein n=1 Tax=Citromicrobium bathyomarinum TaxID=72174 RepID=UPI00315B37AC